MQAIVARLGGIALALLADIAAPRARACVPGCSGYHLVFTGPAAKGGSALTRADQAATVTWQDAVDGPNATFDLLMSSEPLPAYPMHSFPAQLPGRVLALGLSAGEGSWTWDTSRVTPGTYFLYAVFHNSPFNTLVMPFAVVSVSHGEPAIPAIIVRSPRGVSAATGTISIAYDADAAGGATSVTLYVGTPPEAADGVLIATGLSAAAAQSVQWDSSLAAAGSYVFKTVVRDGDGKVLASAFSPGTVEVGPAVAAASCATGATGGAGGFAPWALILLAGLRWRRPAS